MRTDIQALRGLAVLLVMFYHATPARLKAGYLAAVPTGGLSSSPAGPGNAWSSTARCSNTCAPHLPSTPVALSSWLLMYLRLERRQRQRPIFAAPDDCGTALRTQREMYNSVLPVNAAIARFVPVIRVDEAFCSTGRCVVADDGTAVPRSRPPVAARVAVHGQKASSIGADSGTRPVAKPAYNVTLVTRRTLLAFPMAALGGAHAQERAPSNRPRVAVIMNVYFPNSHADVFVGRLLEGYRLNGRSYRPRVETKSFYVDQFPVNDMAKEQAEEYGVTIYPDVASALRLGGSKLAVDGVAIVGEHGNYPRTPRGNVMYPRWQRFNEVTTLMQQEGKVLPVFHDKYFAYDWDDATKMYQRVKQMKIPFFSGSSLPLTWRKPALEFEPGVELNEIMALSFSDLEEHGYHAVALLQAMAEKRRGGESGVAAIRCVEGDEVWKLGRQGEWSQELLDAALSRRINGGYGKEAKNPQAILVRYRDGLKASILNLDGLTRDYIFAAKLKNGTVQSSCFYIQLWVHNHWSFMVRAFEDVVLTKKTPHPIERNYLSTGITLFGLESRLQGQKWLDTPQLAIRY